MGKSSRSKGRRGEATVKRILTDRDWTVRDCNSGTATDDLLAIDPHGQAWSVEVKNTSIINIKAYRQQAIRQSRKLPWLLACHIDQTRSWLVLRQKMKPVVWHEKDNQ